MTIKQQIQAAMEHPYYREALADSSCMEHLLFELMFGMYATVTANCARAYRANRGKNNPDVLAAIREIEPPSNLDIRLPIHAPTASVIPMYKEGHPNERPSSANDQKEG